jgi:hypothetical protein
MGSVVLILLKKTIVAGRGFFLPLRLAEFHTALLVLFS